MELDSNLIALQGVLRDFLKTTGDFSKIKYKGGNEMKISHIVDGMKQYMLNTFQNENNSEYSKQLQNLTQFLIINTKFEDNSLLNMEEYFHLINVIPLLSKCLLANLIIELKLATHYCSLMPTMPLRLNEELLNEMITCLKQCEPQQALEDTYNILTAIIRLLGTLNPKQNEDFAENFADIASEMLTNISGINTDLVQSWKKPQMHRHIGYTLLYLLSLLKECPLYENNLSRIADDLIRVTIILMQAVTVNVFCDWAEVKDEHDQPIQTVIAGAAYLVTEHLQKYKPGKELVQMLGTIAKKPKTITEIILESDTATIISSINKSDNNQKRWFKAFMGTNVLQNEESLACLNKWSHLCTSNDVTRLLNMSTHKEPRVKAVIIKCARKLNTEELSLVTARYFRECSINNLSMESVKEPLTTLLNKTQSSSEADENFTKEIYLLLLQNPNLVLSTLYAECLKKAVHTQRLKITFKNIKPAIEVNNFSNAVFIEVFKKQPPTSENILCYKELLEALLELSYFKDHVLINEIFTPQLQKFYDEDDYDSLLCTLQILNLISIKTQLTPDAITTIRLLGNIMEKARCQFLTFLNIKQQIVQETVNLMLKYSTQDERNYLQCKDYLDKVKLTHCINTLYVTNLYQEKEIQLLKYVYPALNIHNHPEAVSKLIKLLPSCVASEWILITKELESQFGYQKTLKVFQDILLLLCQITSTQLNPNSNESVVISGLRFCLQQYGIVIKEVLQPKYTSLEDETLLTKNICYLLKDVPKGIRKEEGLQLIGLLSNQSLHSLKEDRKFILSLIAIEDTTISQSLAQRMLK